METRLKYIKEIKPVQQLYQESAEEKKPSRIQVFFDARVLDTYAKSDSYRVIRSDTMGRVSKTGGWTVDFGVCPTAAPLIHATAESVFQHIPDSERSHWLDYMVTIPVSQNYIRGLIRASCLDDGEIREW